MQLSPRHKDPQQAHFLDIPVVMFLGGISRNPLIIQTMIVKYLNVRKWLFDGAKKDHIVHLVQQECAISQ